MKKRVKPIRKTLEVLGDKSISHRALIISSISNGESHIYNMALSKDCMSTLNCLKDLGVKIEKEKNFLKVCGKGVYSFKESCGVLDAGNSGTTIRLLSGILSAQQFKSCITGDNSLKKRPMDRIIKPLSLMGANIKGENNSIYAPLFIDGRNLLSIDYKMEVESAQVKSCILFAGLYAKGQTSVIEYVKTRDHTERMLDYFGANIKISQNKVMVQQSELLARKLEVPGDISSASFFMALGALVKDSNIVIKNLCLNDTRAGILKVLNKMNVGVRVHNLQNNGFENIGDVEVFYKGELKPIHIRGDIIPTLIDEIPIICILACFAEGETLIEDIDELRYKESDRVSSIVLELKKLGVSIEETSNGIKILGSRDIKINKVDSHNDHRIAMSLSILGVVLNEEIDILNKECVDISFPGFYEKLREIIN